MGLKQIIDINCDLGEGMTNDAELMPYISSCNIACGGHFGTKETIRTTIRLAKQHEVKIGAHPSYPDQENFGRKSIMISDLELKTSIKRQLTDFLAVCDEEGIAPHHIKLHGALYNDSEENESISRVISEVCSEMNLSLPFYVSPRSLLKQKVKSTLIEAFIDRRYEDNGSLVSRTHPKALIQYPPEAWLQLERLFFDHEVISVGGKSIPLEANTFCIHGDTQNALEVLQFIQTKLKSINIELNKNG